MASSSSDPEWRRGHRQVVPGPSPARQTVPDLAARLATRGLEPERRRHARHQLRPAVCSSQAGTRSVLSPLHTHTHRKRLIMTACTRGKKKCEETIISVSKTVAGNYFTLLCRVLSRVMTLGSNFTKELRWTLLNHHCLIPDNSCRLFNNVPNYLITGGFLFFV